MKNKLIAFLALTFLGAFHSHLSTARAQSPFGNAVSLANDREQYVSVPTAAGSAVNSPFTIESWVSVSAHEDWSRLMDFGNGAGFNNIVCALSSSTSGQPSFYFFNGSAAIIGSLVSPSTLPLNTWTHLAFSYDGTNGSIFINGNLATNGPMAAPPVATRTNNFIGRSNFGNPYASALVDEFRIWSVARSPAQIQASRGAPLVGNEAGLMLYYRFDNTSGSGTVATNSATATGAAYNGTLINGPSFRSGPAPPSYRVTTTSDAGAGSLREAINTTPSGGFIYFNANLSGQTISLTNGQLVVTNNLTIDASALASQVTISGNRWELILRVTNSATVVLKSLVIRQGLLWNGSPISGGGIHNSTNCSLTLSNCVVSDNENLFGSGGGIYNAGALILGGCTILGNAVDGGASASGGGIYNVGTASLNECELSGNDAGSGGYAAGNNGAGGGIYNSGSLTLTRCTLQDNAARGGRGYNADCEGDPIPRGGGDGRDAFGGGLYSAGSATVNQCTFARNSSIGGSGGGGCNGGSAGNNGSSQGGGIYNSGLLTLNQNTISAGGAVQGGGIYNTAPGTNCTLLNCLIAGNSGNSDVSGFLFSRGYNLIGATNGSTGFDTNTDLKGTITSPLDPLLSGLANRGGATLTFALLPGSPAIDAGDDSVTNSFSTDQRGTGFPRRVGPHVDIGAYEADGSGVSAPSIGALTYDSVSVNPVTRLSSLVLRAQVNPNSSLVPTTVWMEYGATTSYALVSPTVSLAPGTNFVSVDRALTGIVPGFPWHYRWIATNYFGSNASPDQTFYISSGGVLGDTNGDGVVSQAELDAVYANYVTNSPWLFMTNVAGLGGTDVSFSLSNSVLGAHSVQYSTNLVNWYDLGPATPRYLFTDTNAPVLPQRYYRLMYL